MSYPHALSWEHSSPAQETHGAVRHGLRIRVPRPPDCPSETLQRPEGKGGGSGTESPPLQLTPGNQRDQPRTRPGAHAGERPRARHPHVSCPQPRAGEGPLRP